MKDPVEIPTRRRHAVKGAPFDGFATQLDAQGGRKSNVDTGEGLSTGRKSDWHVRIAARMADADDQGPAISLHANRSVDSVPPFRGADIVRPADTRLNEQLRNAGGDHRALLEPVV